MVLAIRYLANKNAYCPTNEYDDWPQKIIKYVYLRNEITVTQVLTEALNIDPRQQGRNECRRVTAVLQSIGWKRQPTSCTDPATGKRRSMRIWRNPTIRNMLENCWRLDT